MPTGAPRAFPHRAVISVLAVILVLTLAGAGLVLVRPWGGAQADSDGEDPLVGPTYYANPEAVCELFDPEELELVLGHPYASGVEPPVDLPALHAMPGSVRCLHSSSLAGGPGEWVATSVVYAYAKQVFEHTLAYRARSESTDPVEVQGLGDRAVVSGGDLLVLQDDKLLGIHLAKETPTERDRLIYTRRLAEKALERLR